MSDSGARRFSPLAFAVAVVTVGAGTAAGLAVVPVAGTYLGMLLGGAASGLLVEDRPVLEAGVAAALAGLGVLLAGTVVGAGLVSGVLALAGVPPTTLVVSVGLGFAVGAFGAHFGDDVRDGLTEPVEASDPSPTVFESAESPLATESTEDAAVEEGRDDRSAEATERSRDRDASETAETDAEASTDVEYEYE